MTPKESIRHQLAMTERVLGERSTEVFKGMLETAPDYLAIVRLKMARLTAVSITNQGNEAVQAAVLELYNSISEAVQPVLLLAAHCPGLAMLMPVVPEIPLAKVPAGEKVN